HQLLGLLDPPALRDLALGVERLVEFLEVLLRQLGNLRIVEDPVLVEAARPAPPDTGELHQIVSLTLGRGQRREAGEDRNRAFLLLRSRLGAACALLAVTIAAAPLAPRRPALLAKILARGLGRSADIDPRARRAALDAVDCRARNQ